jgi:WXXGXW repeat (2 copies)
MSELSTYDSGSLLKEIDMLHAKAKTRLLAGLGIALLGAAGCGVDVYTPAPRGAVIVDENPPPPEYGSEVVVEAPPAPYEEVVPASPGPNYIWVGGYWGRRGGHYYWYRGHYARGNGHHRWVAGYWNHGSHGYIWVEGRWE